MSTRGERETILSVARRHARHVFLADVGPSDERQAEGAPQRVGDDPGQGDPDVAVDELLAGRPWRGVVVDAGCPVYQQAAATWEEPSAATRRAPRVVATDGTPEEAAEQAARAPRGGTG